MTLEQAANNLAEELRSYDKKIVFAESCTGGLVSATLTRIPGISNYHCGSFVTYRNDSKVDWLNVRKETIEKHTAVSREVARQMALGAFEMAPESHLAISVTGHLGPIGEDDPPELDGVIYCGSCSPEKIQRFSLATSGRIARQEEAAKLVLLFATERVRVESL